MPQDKPLSPDITAEGSSDVITKMGMADVENQEATFEGHLKVRSITLQS